MAPDERLRGMAWDHPRAVDPLEAISARWSADNGVSVAWDARPLKDFEDQPLEELASRYDLILIDHPFVGFAATSGLIVPVEEWADDTYLADQASASVGPSYRSYTWNERQWALAADAACQVSGVRNDLLDAGDAPETWDQVMDLAGKTADASARVAIPLNANHGYCAFLSIGVSLAGRRFWEPGATVDAETGRQALEYLREIAPLLHPLSREADPIAISDRMTMTDDIFYVPLMFGYSSYARHGFRPARIRFGDAPEGADGNIGSVLGGVGIALSARCKSQESAADLARLVASREMQCGLYAAAGGQPGHAAAWESSEVNAMTDDFFIATRRTIEQAFVRPRVPGHRRFQVLAGELIHRYVWEKDLTTAACLSELDGLVGDLLPDWR